MINVIADRYAQALFEVGEETQTTSELYQELSELVDIFNENKDLYNFLKSPLIGREDKKNVMQNIFKNQLSNSMNNFLKLVIDKDRISAIENMKESYKSLLNDKNNILEDGTEIRKGAFDAIRKIALSAGNPFPKETEDIIQTITSNGGTPLVWIQPKKPAVTA